MTKQDPINRLDALIKSQRAFLDKMRDIPMEAPPESKIPPAHSQEHWEKELSWAIFCGPELSMARFMDLFHQAWADAYAKGVRDAKR